MKGGISWVGRMAWQLTKIPAVLGAVEEVREETPLKAGIHCEILKWGKIGEVNCDTNHGIWVMPYGVQYILFTFVYIWIFHDQKLKDFIKVLGMFLKRGEGINHSEGLREKDGPYLPIKMELGNGWWVWSCLRSLSRIDWASLTKWPWRNFHPQGKLGNVPGLPGVCEEVAFLQPQLEG